MNAAFDAGDGVVSCEGSPATMGDAADAIDVDYTGTCDDVDVRYVLDTEPGDAADVVTGTLRYGIGGLTDDMSLQQCNITLTQTCAGDDCVEQ